VAEVGPDADESYEGDDLGTLPLDIIKELGGSKGGIRNVHAHVHSVSNDGEVEQVTPSEDGYQSACSCEFERTYPTSQRVTKWCATSS